MTPDRERPFERGEPVVLRSIRTFGAHGRRVGFAVAGVVVADSADVSVVCTPVGSGVRTRHGRGSGPNARLVLPDDWDGSYDERDWHGADVVRVHRRGEPWSVWRWHDGTRWVGEWYGNLELPWRRTTMGFDSQDWALDVVAAGDPATEDLAVRFKDEDELAFLVEAGQLSPTDADRVREAGGRLVEVARRRAWPFDADWSAWAPDPSWAAVPMPAGATELG